MVFLRLRFSLRTTSSSFRRVCCAVCSWSRFCNKSRIHTHHADSQRDRETDRQTRTHTHAHTCMCLWACMERHNGTDSDCFDLEGLISAVLDLFKFKINTRVYAQPGCSTHLRQVWAKMYSELNWWPAAFRHAWFATESFCLMTDMDKRLEIPTSMSNIREGTKQKKRWQKCMSLLPCIWPTCASAWWHVWWLVAWYGRAWCACSCVCLCLSYDDLLAVLTYFHKLMFSFNSGFPISGNEYHSSQ